MSIEKEYIVFCSGLVAIVFLPVLFMHGMFLDGVTYASISRNLAEGNGSLWRLTYTQTLYAEFYEHPPLVLWLQSLFYRILGDSFWIERLYSVLVSLGIIIVGSSIVKIITGLKATSFPILTVTSPLFIWVAYHNMLESTMVLFCLASVWFILRSVDHLKISNLLGASFCLILALMSKGPVALFVLMSPLILLSLHQTSIRKCLILSASLIAGLLVFATCVFFQEGANEYFSAYISRQLGASLSGERGTGSRISFLLESLSQFAIVLAVAMGLCFFLSRKIKLNRKALFPLILSLFAFFPLFVSPRLFRHYSYPCLVFIIISCAVQLDLQSVHSASRISSISKKKLAAVGFLLLAVAIALSLIFHGKYLRDKNMISSIQELEVVDQTVLCAPSDLASDWLGIAYLQRYRKLSIDPNKDCSRKSQLVKSDDGIFTILEE